MCATSQKGKWKVRFGTLILILAGAPGYTWKKKKGSDTEEQRNQREAYLMIVASSTKKSSLKKSSVGGLRTKASNLRGKENRGK